MKALRTAFVMEQTLGHVTHYQNLAMAVQRQTAVLATWVLVQYPAKGLERLIPAFSSNWSVRASYRARQQLARDLATRPHDALFFHTQVTSLFSIGLMRRLPTVISLDATPINYDSVAQAYGHRPAGTGWVDDRKYQLNRDAFAAARALVCWSEWAKTSLITDYGVVPDKVRVLAPGADRHFFAIGEQRVRDIVPGRPIRILFVGGDFERKGGPLLLEAMRAMRTERPFELHVVTKQPVAEQPGLVVHLGVRPNSSVLYRLFREADAFVLPSRGECLSVALMEASAAGLPIIATDVGAQREAARHNVNALVVAPNDGASLRVALEAMVDDDGLRARLGAAGHALARSKFDAERNDQQIIDLVASIARPVAARSVA